MPPDLPRRAQKIFLAAARLEKLLGPASHSPQQNPGSAPVMQKKLNKAKKLGQFLTWQQIP